MTSATETSPPDMAAFDQNEADTAWEHTEEQALRAFRAGETVLAKNGWARALDIATRHFKRGDPRIAASYTNQAFSLLRQQQSHQAKQLFDNAVRCWEDSWRWVPLMVPPRIGDRIEEAQYSAAVQKEFYALITCGQSITETLAREQHPPIGSLEDWRACKPRTMCDERKLMSAVFLIVSKKP